MAKNRNYRNRGPGGEAGEKSFRVFKAEEKLIGIARYLNLGTGIEPLANFLGLAVTAFRDAAKDESFTATRLQELGTAFSAKGHVFDFNWKEWRDARYDLDGFAVVDETEREDRPEAFLKAFALHNPQKSALAALPEASTNSPAPLVAIAAGKPQKPIPSIPEGLAVIAIEGLQWGIGSAYIALTLSCGRWRGATIPHGRVTFDVLPGVLSASCYQDWRNTLVRTVSSTKLDGSQGRVTFTLEGAVRQAPGWRVSGLGDSIGIVEPDPSLFAVEGLRSGCEVRASFGTWISAIDDDSEALEMRIADSDRQHNWQEVGAA